MLPVGRLPRAKTPARMSARSAIASARPVGVGGKPVAGVARQILFLDGSGHRGRLAVLSGVVITHAPLQLRELAHHLGQQVGLRQQGGALDDGRVVAE